MTNDWPIDTTAAKMAYYGDFREKPWASVNLTRVSLPFKMTYEGKLISGVLCHRKIAPALARVFAEIWRECDQDQARVVRAGAAAYGGCFNVRRIAGSRSWSNHSWACAIDLSPNTNGFNMKSTLSRVVIDAFKREEFRWGGDYVGRKDPMHFEAVRPK